MTTATATNDTTAATTVQQVRKFNSITEAAHAYFTSLLPKRLEMGNRAFRKDILVHVEYDLGATHASAASIYNNVFKDYKAKQPELVEGLGRPEGKNNGGRRRVVQVVVDTLMLGHDTTATTPPAESAGAVQAEEKAAVLEISADVAEAPKEEVVAAPVTEASEKTEEVAAEVPKAKRSKKTA